MCLFIRLLVHLLLIIVRCDLQFLRALFSNHPFFQLNFHLMQIIVHRHQLAVIHQRIGYYRGRRRQHKICQPTTMPTPIHWTMEIQCQWWMETVNSNILVWYALYAVTPARVNTDSMWFLSHIDCLVQHNIWDKCTIIEWFFLFSSSFAQVNTMEFWHAMVARDFSNAVYDGNWFTGEFQF